ncbi:hypothetical protein J6590_077138 [Homalodisca vitripennis]|nr:hypothetical protein J6590_077138 [Homalodisca vitripennis]
MEVYSRKYMENTWMRMIGPETFSVFSQCHRTNNALEGFYNRLLQRMGPHPGVWQFHGTYNEGNIVRCQVLDRLGIRPGANCAKRMKRIDELRVQKADKANQEIEIKCRQKRSMLKKRLEDQYEMEEDPDNPSYGAGMH